ncbi:undecaprenyl-diphosphate phosphatase [Enhygromyxa salina]|uniref:Undecaprenyl-diphosphatase n=1 Tax=Enhygromyxa salina TaxID=215803 RepID=A0A2S9YNU1_9BACT|nr:undecaprenyl-diphosphate phosphatase [Enhygromyxa salina]PRQ06747.1 Undecaprenyl-diphosphatase [Enhygromyxa salina]
MLASPGAELGYGLAAFLGAVQGVAEFLPISSSGHLSLAEAWLGVDAEAAGHSFNIVVHAGTLLAVLVVFRRDLAELVRGLLDPQAIAWARPMWLALIIGSLPLGVVLLPGVEELVVRMEGEVRWIGAALILTAALLAFTHRSRPPTDDRASAPRLQHALLIGCAQLLAVTPGVSRSGSTIAAGLALGLGRARAARFSFLLSIPAITAATGKEALDLLGGDAPTHVAAGPFALGFVVSFAVGLVSLQLLLRLIEKVGMLPFVPYLAVLGTIALVVG